MSELPSNYKTIRGSDVIRDGMYLELIALESGDEVAEIFRSDESQEIMISIFKQDMPLEVIEAFIAKAKLALPPSDL